MDRTFGLVLLTFCRSNLQDLVVVMEITLRCLDVYVLLGQFQMMVLHTGQDVTDGQMRIVSSVYHDVA